MENFFSTLLNMSMTASIVIICVILVRIFLKKTPKVFSYSLWSIVLFRLVCPFSFESVLSLIPKKDSLPIVNFNPPTVSQPIYVPTDAINQAVSSTPQMEQATTASLMSVLMIIWAIGVFALLFYSAISYLSLKIKVCTATKLENNIFECETVTSPFVLGLIKPKIYLPLNLSDEQKHYILKHEQTHIKRFDYIIKPVSFLVLCMHWFNPLVWLAFALMSKDMELSCDEAVLKQLGNDIKKDYSASLLSFATSKKMLNGSPLAFGESNVKARIKNVLNYKKPAFWVIIVAVIAVVAVGIGLAANPKEASKTAGISGVDAFILEIDYDNKTMLVEGIGENSVIGDKCRVDCKNANFIEVDGDKIKPINITDLKVSEHIILNINEVAESYPTKTSATTVQRNQADTQIGKPVKNKIMAQAKLENGYELQLVLVNGRSFLGEEAGMSAYTHETNFQGEYEIRTIKNDKIVSKITKELQKAILWDGVNLNFDKEFAFALDDYNGDGNIDFSIGQPLGSNGNIYLLFSVDDKGNLSILTVNTDLFAASHEFSKKFDKISDTAFSFSQYDNSIAQEIKYIATWNGKSFNVEKAKSPYSIEVMKNGDMQLSINNTSDFAEFGKRNEGFAYFEKATNHLHVGITTAFGQPKATDENPVGSLAGAKVEFDLDFTDEIKLLNVKFTGGGSDENLTLKISDERLTEIGLKLYEIIEQSAQKEKAASLLTWAQRLSAKDVGSIELVVEPSSAAERYKKYSTAEFADIVELIKKSKGEFMPYNETLSGSIQNLYITLNDGTRHTVTNGGNIYLVIDGQFYKGNSTLLKKWALKGNETVPATFYITEPATVIVKEGELSPDAFVAAVVQSFQIKEGVARLSIPNEAPAGYPLSQLSIHVSGAMPMGNDSTMSLHAFEQADIDKKWQLGQQYIERIFDAKVPDGTEVYINVSLMEEDGNSSYYYAGNSKIFPLRVDSFTPNVKTTASTVTFTNKFNDTLKLALTLPKGFSMKAPAMGDAIEFGRHGSVLIYNGNTEVGTIHYNDFDLVRDENGDIPYVSVYNSIMLGSVASWDNEYTVVSQTKDTCIATVKPLHRIDVPGVSGAALENAVDKGILAYDATLQKYVAIYLDNQAVSDVQLADIAKSVKLSGKIEK